MVDYVVDEPKPLLLNDIVISTFANQSVLIEPIGAQIDKQTGKIIITELNAPKIGGIEIRDNNTIIYTPLPDKTGQDEFDYTTSVSNSDKTVSTQNGNVLVSIMDEGQSELSAGVLYWKRLFDITWASPGVKGKSDAMKYATSNGANQEYYYLAWHLDGLIQIWQATGDNKYLNDAIQIIQATINNALPVHNGKYKGWPATKHGKVPNGYPLWESYMYRYVASLLRIMYKSPNLRAMDYDEGSYQHWYDSTLAFVEKNIWEKWYNDTPRNLYRSNTHMASHWARIGMELYIITGKQQYLNVFNNISYAGFPKGMQGPAGSNLRRQLFEEGNALFWASDWGGKYIQDTSHGADVVSFWVTAHENKMYWTKEDIDGLVSTLNTIVWTSNRPIKFSYFVDGTGKASNIEASFHNFITLGRFNQELQNRIKKYYNPITMKHKTAEAMGIAALNQKILEDGRPVYPEQY